MSARGGHRPAGWQNIAMDLTDAGHVGKKMARELAEAEQGAQFGSNGSNGRKETVVTGKTVTRPKSTQLFSRRHFIKAIS